MNGQYAQKYPEAIISVCKADDNFEIFSRLTNELDKFVETGPESEQTLPVLFNEYCTTWGNHSHDEINMNSRFVFDLHFCV